MSGQWLSLSLAAAAAAGCSCCWVSEPAKPKLSTCVRLTAAAAAGCQEHRARRCLRACFILHRKVNVSIFHPGFPLPPFGRGREARRAAFEARRVRTARFVFGEEGILAPPTREPHPSPPPDRALRITHDCDLGRGPGSVAAAACGGVLRTHTDAPRAPNVEFRVGASQNGGMEYAFRLYPVAPPVSAPWRALRPRLAGPEAEGKRSGGNSCAPNWRFGYDGAACIQASARPRIVSGGVRDPTRPLRRPTYTSLTPLPPRTRATCDLGCSDLVKVIG